MSCPLNHGLQCTSVQTKKVLPQNRETDQERDHVEPQKTTPDTESNLCLRSGNPKAESVSSTDKAERGRKMRGVFHTQGTWAARKEAER